MTPCMSLASANLRIMTLIRSPMSLAPFSAAISAKPPPAGTSMSASRRPACRSETYFMNSSVRT